MTFTRSVDAGCSSGEVPLRFQRGLRIATVGTILFAHAIMLGWSASKNAPTYDEVGWLAAGISHWELGRFELARVNPPFVRMLAALPVVVERPTMNWAGYSGKPGARAEFGIGEAFIKENGDKAFAWFVVARIACIPLSLIGALLCFRWSYELFGFTAGLLSLLLWVLCPNILGHAQLITADVGATVSGLAASYAFWKWVCSERFVDACVAGFFFGVALLCKTTLLVFVPLWPLLYLVIKRRAPRRQAIHLIGIYAIALYIVNVGYGFDGSFKKLGEFRFVSRRFSGIAPFSRDDGGNRFSDSWSGRLRVPVPEQYLLGIDHISAELEEGKLSYLRGEWRRRGWWYYYLYAALVKVPLGSWSVFVAACVSFLLWPQFRASYLDEVCLVAPGIALMAMVSAQPGFTSHLRYALPAFPYAFIWSARAGRFIAERRWLLGTTIVTAVGWLSLSSLSVFPHGLSYFNELAGGPEGGHAHLVDSNIDWGQDLFFLKRWLDSNPHARPFGLAYGSLVDPCDVGILYNLPPRWRRDAVDTSHGGPMPGYYAISVNLLRGMPLMIHDGQGGRVSTVAGDFRHFLEIQPVARAGYSILIFHVDIELANKWRADLGFSPLPAE